MADDNLKTPVEIQQVRIDSSILPPGFPIPYKLYVIQSGTDMGNTAAKANQAAGGAWSAQQRNDEQDEELEDHSRRIGAAELTLVNHEQRISGAESALASHEARITQNTADISALETRMDTAEGDIGLLQSEVANHEIRISALEYATTRKKAEVIYTGLSLTIPTAGANLINLIKTLTPASGSLSPFFDTATDKMKVYNENKSLMFKLSIIGSWPGGTTNRSMQLTFSGSVPDTLVSSRNSATATDNILLATFFSVDKDGFLATNGSTLTIQSNGAAFTATTIKIIAEQ
ncbi:tail needle knob protein [Serratia entomophila]|uniref:tail needle knob protein n=1 Tax=Serratia entomophila TaxID=42906 RepID=UPI0021789F3A|nr:tail needle knob protein [Serratia entomophila]CAI1782797.1 Uncharacterised protein [Serratia entomophila]